MTYTVEILGVDKTSLVKADSISVTRGADNRNSCSLSLITTASAMGTTEGALVGQDLVVKDSGDVIFGGAIKTVHLTKLEPSVGNTVKIQVDITSDGYNHIPARRTIDAWYTDMDCGDIVTEIVTNVLASDGVTAGTIDAGITLTRYNAVCKSVKDIFDDLANASGFKWYIDDSKALHFIAEDSVTAAAHDIVEGGAFTDFTIEGIDISMENYRNKQFVKGGTGTDGAIVQACVEDATEITARQTAEGGSTYSTGVYGDVMEDSNITNTTDAEAAATNEIKKYGVMPYSLSFTSRTLDWEPGTKLKVNLPTFGIASDTYYLIESITLSIPDGANFIATIEATKRKPDDFSTQRTQTSIDYLGDVVKAAKDKGTASASSSGSGGNTSFETATNAASVSVISASETVAATKDIIFSQRSKAIILFSCEIAIADGAANLTGKVYVDGAALTFQPTLYCAGANTYTFAFHAVKEGIESGTKTVLVKLQTDTNSGTIAIGHAVMTVIIYPFAALADVSGFTAIVADYDEIDLAWTNPTGCAGVAAYRSTSDLITKDQIYCAANATSVYAGTGESYNNTGLSELTKYYYRIFAKYTIEGTDYYSPGVSVSATTPEEIIPDYQPWASYPDSPLLTASFPYQWIGATSGGIQLHMSTAKYYYTTENGYSVEFDTTGDALNYLYDAINGEWDYVGHSKTAFADDLGSTADIKEANNDVYTDNSYTDVYFAKTT